MKSNKYIINLLISFYKFTHFVEKTVDFYIKQSSDLVKKKKNEYIKIIQDYQLKIINIWIEYQIGDLVKISLFIFLILWVMFQSYYYGGMSHISYEKYVQLKKLFVSLEQKNEQYLNAIQTQNNDIEIMNNVIKKYKHQLNASIFSASLMLLVGSTLGFVVGGVLTLITMSK